MINVKIVKGMPIPNGKQARGWSAKAQAMAVGDCAIANNAYDASRIGQAIRNAGYRAIQQKLEDGTTGVWKVERESK